MAPTVYPPALLRSTPDGLCFGAFATGLAFAATQLVVGRLWGLEPNPVGRRLHNVNVNQFNSINANRGQISSSRWNAGNAAGRR